ncbi:amidase [Sphingopyxis sp. OAS728]|uniref:amidase family protein n=1 Tax=Sphingopyxis sp. OAS728 TaxID=2663823 RepID=UPI001A0057B5|nr:amidase family protein [Sphingopyxis sp. OAS728]MBE1526505.1 amidase [Sphingopyxis sp. OAS728]
MMTDMVAMREALADERTTAAALVEQAIERAEAVNPQLNFIAFRNYGRAREQAAAPRPGPLAGIPTLIKDMLPEKGLPAAFGSAALRDFIAPADAPYAQAIGKAGPISIARSSMPELGLNAVTESPLIGPTRNPWSLDHTPGGSSGGGAAAVAAGVVPVAHASDGLGSIRHGAAPCGLVGLKPSRGRNAGEEAFRAITDLTVNGCVSRTVRDTAAWLAATQTHDAACLLPVELVDRPVEHRLRIHAYSAVMRTGAAPDASVARVFGEAVALLDRFGHHVSDAALPFDGPAAMTLLGDITEGMFARRLGMLSQQIGIELRADDLEHRSATLIAAGEAMSDEHYAAAWGAMEDVVAAYLERLEQIDIWMTPTLSHEIPRIGVFGPDVAWGEQRDALIDYAGYCWIDNFAGTPAISLPVGFSDTGLPVGIQFATRVGGEALLLALAYQLEAALEWKARIPPIWVGALPGN